MNVPLALALRESRGQWLLADALARKSDLTADALPSALRDLLNDGFEVEVRAGGAVRLATAPEALDPQQLTWHLDTQVIGCLVSVCRETASTNDLAWEMLAAGGPEGACSFAEHQTQGRGRLGRRWEAPPGAAILMSVGLRPRLAPAAGTALTFAASVAAAESIAAIGVPCAIEWPNDITVNDRKVAGILVESRRLVEKVEGRSEEGRRSKVEGRREDKTSAPAATASPLLRPSTFNLRPFVVGIGINANVALSALPADVQETATSLKREAGRNIDRTLLARQLMQSFDTWYGVLARGDLPLIQDRWLELTASLGRRVVIAHQGRTYAGVVVDVSPDEGLALRLDQGVLRYFQPASSTIVSRSGRT